MIDMNNEMYVDKFTLLTKEQSYGNKRLDIFYTLGSLAEATDAAFFSGVMKGYFNDNYAYYRTRTRCIY